MGSVSRMWEDGHMPTPDWISDPTLTIDEKLARFESLDPVATGGRIQIWPPSHWCGVINPEQTHICDQSRNHPGDHTGPELPTVTIDEGEL